MTLRPYLEGLSTFLPGRASKRAPRRADELARYGYSVWLRHLVLATGAGMEAPPRTVLEVGVGPSLAVGLAGLLSGAERLFACDVHADVVPSRDQLVVDELVRLFMRRAAVPGDDEFPRVNPKLERYDFPGDILSKERLAASLAAERTQAIRDAVGKPECSDDGAIRYWAPATVEDVRLKVGPESVDLILSQAVMQYVSNLPSAYGAMYSLLRPGGTISQQVDFGAHQTCPDWDGHWRYSDRQWRVIRGSRAHFLNRVPITAHLDALHEAGLNAVAVRKVTASPTRSRDLVGSASSLSETDRTTRSALIVARRPAA